MSNCPLPLIRRGQTHKAGGVITDNGNVDFVFESIEIFSYRNYSVGWNLDLFQTVGGTRTAHPVTQYSAAMGLEPGETVTDPPQPTTEDHGEFKSYRDTRLESVEPRATGLLYINYHKSVASVSVAGPELPLRYLNYTWTAAGSNGTPPYSYSWYRNGTLVSQLSSYSATMDTSDFGLRAEMTDAQGLQNYHDVFVDVDGIRVTIDGPDQVWYSGGGGTWTAVARGGQNPYSFEWYVIDSTGTITGVGTGPSWTGYPGEGSTTLHVKVTNGTAEHHDAEKAVWGIGSPNGGCVPPPPQEICGP